MNLNNNNNIIQALSNNPLFYQAQRMCQGKSKEEIEQIARNLCNERGLNYDEALSSFQKQMKGFM